MSKCTDLNNKISGRVGDLVYFVRGGQQIVRSVPASVKNPRTEAQMRQRMKWANVLAVYKALQPCLKGCFEVKAAGQTDYNRFMSTNLQSSPVYLEKGMARMGAAVVAPYVVSQGSLPEVQVSGEIPATDIALGTLIIGDATTVREFAQAVVRHNDDFCYGDCISFLMLRQHVDTQDGHPYVTLSAACVCLDPADTTRLRGIASAEGFSVVGGALGAGAVLAGAGVAWVHSRTVNGKTHVSSQRLVVENALLDAYSASRMLSVAARSYGGAQRLSAGGVPRFGAAEGVRRACIEPVRAAEEATGHLRPQADVQVEVDDGEGASLPQRFVHEPEDGGREQVDACEGQLPVRAGKARGTHFAGLLVGPSVQTEAVVEEEVARSGAWTHEEGGFVSISPMGVDEGVEVGIGQDVGVVHQERFVPVQKTACVEDASSGVQQGGAFVADVDVQSEVPVGLEEVDDLLAPVVDVDGDVCDADVLQFQEDPLEQGNTCYRYQGLRDTVGEGTEACAQSCCEYHGFHAETILFCGKVCRMPRSRCSSSTCTPNVSLRLYAAVRFSSLMLFILYVSAPPIRMYRPVARL